MLNIYLSDQGFKSFFYSSQAYSFEIAQLAKKVECIKELYLHKYSNIKRLKFVRPTVWRYRCGEIRIIFTVNHSNNNPYLIVHRISHRSDVYERLPKYFTASLSPDDEPVDQQIEYDDKFQDFDRYYKIPRHLIDSAQNSEAIIEFITSGEYLFNPCLNSNQKDLLKKINQKFYSQVYQIQGTAGTGKTTIAFSLAYMAVKKGFFPLIIVPNRQLKRFGETSLINLEPCLNIQTDEVGQNLEDKKYDLALFSKNDFLQTLAGDENPTLTPSEGCKLIKDSWSQRGIIKKKFINLNLYAIVQSFIVGENYGESSKDSLTLNYQNLITIFKKNWQEKHNKIFANRDAFSQAKRAEQNLNQQIHRLKSLTDNKQIMLIIDEVQDFYWFQLKVLFDLVFNFGKNHDLATTVIILGDENQRVTISGFSWSSFRTIFAKYYDHQKLIDCFELTQNFRNTKQIATAAKYILETAFKEKIKNQKTRHPPKTGDPAECYEEGKLPRLIQIDQDWLEDLLEQVEQLGKTSQTSTENENVFTKIVFIQRDLLELPETITEKFDQLEEQVIVYTISEAKGQEFDAAVILFPFQTKQKQLAIDDLFEWYTAMTRSRYYQYILVWKEQMEWLKQSVNDENELKTIFKIETAVNPEEFAQDLQKEGKNLITLQQMRLKFLNKLVAELLYWLQTGVLPTPLTTKWEKSQFTWWELAEELSENIFDLIEQKELNNVQLRELNNCDPFEAVVLYSGAKILWENSGLNHLKIGNQVIKGLQNIVINQPDLLEQALEKVKNFYLKSLLLRAKSLSWEAAYLLKKSDRHQEIEEIALQLEERGLHYEAIRIRVQLLKKTPPKNKNFSEVFTQEGSLVSLLCESFINQLPNTKI